MSKNEEFEKEVDKNISSLGNDLDLQGLSRIWGREISRHRYTHNFRWMGRPIIQFPQDIVAMQELIWTIQPDLIVETGIAHGGSMVFYASMLELNAACGGPSDAQVLGVDIDIRAHNKEAIELHPMFKRISMIQGSSIDPVVVSRVKEKASGKRKVLVCLDSNHTHDHVLAELNAYASLTTVGSYCVVFDTLVDDMPAELFTDRPWGPGNSPKTAVREFLKNRNDFEIDRRMDHKLLISVAPDGYLKRIG